MTQMTNLKARFGFAAALMIFAVALVLLITGSPILVVPLSEHLGLPLGNVITWFGMLALVMMIWFGSAGLREPSNRHDRSFRGLWFILLLLAVLWPFVSYALAGNWGFSFRVQEGFRGSSSAADWFFRYSYAVVLLPILFVVARLVLKGLDRLSGSNGTMN